MYAAENEISVYDGAPIEGLVSPDEDPLFRRKYSQQEALYFDDPSANHKSEGWQKNLTIDPILDTTDVQNEGATWRSEKNDDRQKIQKYAVEAPSSEEGGGPLQGKLREWVQERIAWHTGSTDLLHLRSWWSILNKDRAVPKHAHLYQTKRKTISGTVWTKGDICPLFVRVPGTNEIDQVNNVPGRCILFSAQTEHWTETYTHEATRVGISFDYLIQDQDCCACRDNSFCFRCVHLTKNLKKVGINTIYSGGSTTIKYE